MSVDNRGMSESDKRVNDLRRQATVLKAEYERIHAELAQLISRLKAGQLESLRAMRSPDR
jgi:hypothetical protein